MRKTMFWCSLISTALLGTACKKDKTQTAGDQVSKSLEEVQKQRKDIGEERKEVVEERKDVAKERGELQQAQGELATAQVNYVAAVRERLARLDAKINDLSAKPDAKSKDAAIALRARRDALAVKLETAPSVTAAQWDDWRKDVDQTFGQIEKDADDALD